ncbi:hypothetical protein Lal_00050188 [Lupinus albus]|nr:hypothetical protein Lal_00050188 [Lupinus albus]
MPVESACAMASINSSSVASSTIPSEFCKASTALSIETGCKSVLSLHSLKLLPPGLIIQIQRIRIRSLRTNKPRDPIHNINIPKVPTRYNHPIRYLPIKLLQNLNSSSFLPLNPQTIQRIRQINRYLPDQLHAPIKISINAENQRSIRNRLNQLRSRNLISRKENNRRYTCRSTISRQGC